MIRLTLAKEPTEFDDQVRKPGLRALDEMVGNPVARAAGKKFKVVAARKEDIKGSDFPAYWTEALPELLKSYGRLCAYTSFYIHKVTGSPSVDHSVAKTKDWRYAYEWTNYRLICSLMNSRKGVKNLLDPIAIQDEWFELEFVGFQVVPRPGLDGPLVNIIQFTIDELGLNERACIEVRTEYAEVHWEDQTARSWDRLSKQCPFVAREMERQGRKQSPR
ncbi:hypothetical protein QNL75_26610 [Pseudomonas amygdali pv. morsprunorum]|uniref:hypothetical protein n=1 Tax=Pseudomonas amygdali TaxID=47877 RepID=UPI0028906E9A|nr:hypothetical protein [Pseudomonas amygdali]MDT3268631.1 hypothetical protein [Pseudomonas amygdali pv. morsprunorum]